MISCIQETAVVILSYNGKEWHKKFLPGIISEAKDLYDIVLINNASTDDTEEYVRTHFPEVQILTLPVNKGFAYGYAAGLKEIEARYYVLLSSDFEVTKGWFTPLLNAMSRYEGIGACQPKIRYWKDREYFEYAGAGGGYIDKFGYLFCRGRIFDFLEKDHNQYDDPVEVFWASGGCLMVRADVYHKVGGLDQGLYAHMEEVDLCWRIRSAGYKIGYIGDATVYHVGGSVISYGSPQKLFYNFRNNLILLLKNESAAKLVWLFPLRLLLDGVAGIQYLFKGQFRSTVTIIRAHFSFYAQLPHWLRQRKKAQKTAVYKSRSGVYSKSIVWQYFALGRKKFSDLNWLPQTLK